MLGLPWFRGQKPVPTGDVIRERALMVPGSVQAKRGQKP